MPTIPIVIKIVDGKAKKDVDKLQQEFRELRTLVQSPLIITVEDNGFLEAIKDLNTLKKNSKIDLTFGTKGLAASASRVKKKLGQLQGTVGVINLRVNTFQVTEAAVTFNKAITSMKDAATIPIEMKAQVEPLTATKLKELAEVEIPRIPIKFSLEQVKTAKAGIIAEIVEIQSKAMIIPRLEMKSINAQFQDIESEFLALSKLKITLAFNLGPASKQLQAIKEVLLKLGTYKVPLQFDTSKLSEGLTTYRDYIQDIQDLAAVKVTAFLDENRDAETQFKERMKILKSEAKIDIGMKVSIDDTSAKKLQELAQTEIPKIELEFDTSKLVEGYTDVKDWVEEMSLVGSNIELLFNVTRIHTQVSGIKGIINDISNTKPTLMLIETKINEQLDSIKTRIIAIGDKAKIPVRFTFAQLRSDYDDGFVPYIESMEEDAKIEVSLKVDIEKSSKAKLTELAKEAVPTVDLKFSLKELKPILGEALKEILDLQVQSEIQLQLDSSLFYTQLSTLKSDIQELKLEKVPLEFNHVMIKEQLDNIQKRILLIGKEEIPLTADSKKLFGAVEGYIKFVKNLKPIELDIKIAVDEDAKKRINSLANTYIKPIVIKFNTERIEPTKSLIVAMLDAIKPLSVIPLRVDYDELQRDLDNVEVLIDAVGGTKIVLAFDLRYARQQITDVTKGLKELGPKNQMVLNLDISQPIQNISTVGIGLDELRDDAQIVGSLKFEDIDTDKANNDIKSVLSGLALFTDIPIALDYSRLNDQSTSIRKKIADLKYEKGSTEKHKLPVMLDVTELNYQFVWLADEIRKIETADVGLKLKITEESKTEVQNKLNEIKKETIIPVSFKVNLPEESKAEIKTLVNELKDKIEIPLIFDKISLKADVSYINDTLETLEDFRYITVRVPIEHAEKSIATIRKLLKQARKDAKYKITLDTSAVTASIEILKQKMSLASVENKIEMQFDIKSENLHSDIVGHVASARDTLEKTKLKVPIDNEFFWNELQVIVKHIDTIEKQIMAHGFRIKIDRAFLANDLKFLKEYFGLIKTHIEETYLQYEVEIKLNENSKKNIFIEYANLQEDIRVKGLVIGVDRESFKGELTSLENMYNDFRKEKVVKKPAKPRVRTKEFLDDLMELTRFYNSFLETTDDPIYINLANVTYMQSLHDLKTAYDHFVSFIQNEPIKIETNILDIYNDIGSLINKYNNLIKLINSNPIFINLANVSFKETLNDLIGVYISFEDAIESHPVRIFLKTKEYLRKITYAIKRFKDLVDYSLKNPVTIQVKIINLETITKEYNEILSDIKTRSTVHLGVILDSEKVNNKIDNIIHNLEKLSQESLVEIEIELNSDSLKAELQQKLSVAIANITDYDIPLKLDETGFKFSLEQLKEIYDTFKNNLFYDRIKINFDIPHYVTKLAEIKEFIQSKFRELEQDTIKIIIDEDNAKDQLVLLLAKFKETSELIENDRIKITIDDNYFLSDLNKLNKQYKNLSNIISKNKINIYVNTKAFDSAIDSMESVYKTFLSSTSSDEVETEVSLENFRTSLVDLTTLYNEFTAVIFNNPVLIKVDSIEFRMDLKLLEALYINFSTDIFNDPVKIKLDSKFFKDELKNTLSMVQSTVKEMDNNNFELKIDKIKFVKMYKTLFNDLSKFITAFKNKRTIDLKIKLSKTQINSEFKTIVDQISSISKMIDVDVKVDADEAILNLTLISEMLADMTDRVHVIRFDTSGARKNINGLTSNIRGFSKSSGVAETAILGAMTAATMGSHKASSAIKKATKSTKTWSFAMREFGDDIQRIMAVGFGGYIVKQMIEASNEFISFGNALKAILETSENAAMANKFLRDTAQDLGVSYKILTVEYTKFIAAGKEANITAKEFHNAFSRVAETTAVLNMNAEQTHGIFKALTQMMSKGKVQAEELRGQLGEHLYGAFELVAKGMMQTNEQFQMMDKNTKNATQTLDEMLKKGLIQSRDLLIALPLALEQAYGVALPRAMVTGRAEFTRFVNDISILLDDNKENIDDFLFGVSNSMRGFTMAFGEIDPTILDGLSGEFEILMALIKTVTFLVAAFINTLSLIGKVAGSTIGAAILYFSNLSDMIGVFIDIWKAKFKIFIDSQIQQFKDLGKEIDNVVFGGLLFDDDDQDLSGVSEAKEELEALEMQMEGFKKVRINLNDTFTGDISDFAKTFSDSNVAILTALSVGQEAIKDFRKQLKFLESELSGDLLKEAALDLMHTFQAANDPKIKNVFKDMVDDMLKAQNKLKKGGVGKIETIFSKIQKDILKLRYEMDGDELAGKLAIIKKVLMDLGASDEWIKRIQDGLRTIAAQEDILEDKRKAEGEFQNEMNSLQTEKIKLQKEFRQLSIRDDTILEVMEEELSLSKNLTAEKIAERQELREIVQLERERVSLKKTQLSYENIAADLELEKDLIMSINGTVEEQIDAYVRLKSAKESVNLINKKVNKKEIPGLITQFKLNLDKAYLNKQLKKAEDIIKKSMGRSQISYVIDLQLNDNGMLEGIDKISNSFVDLLDVMNPERSEIALAYDKVTKSLGEEQEILESMTKTGAKKNVIDDQQVVVSGKVAEATSLKSSMMQEQFQAAGQIAGSMAQMFQDAADAAEDGSKKQMKLQKTAIGIQIAMAAVYGTIAIIKAFGNSWYEGVAMIVVIAGLMGSLGAQMANVNAASTPPDDTQGKGTIFGDEDAVSESFVNSLEILEEYSDIGNIHSSKMLVYLQSIDSSLKSMASGISISETFGGFEFNPSVGATRYQTVDGSITGIGGSASEGTVGDFYIPKTNEASLNVLESGINLESFKTFGDVLAEGLISEYYAVVETQDTKNNMNMLNLLKGQETNTVGFFADTEPDFDIWFAAILNGVSGSILEGMSVLTDDVPANLEEQVYGTEIGIDRISLKDLDIEERIDALNGVFGAAADSLVEGFLPELKAYQQVGEGLYETFSKVVGQTENATNALTRFGFEAISYTDVLNKQNDVGPQIVKQTIIMNEEYKAVADIMEYATGEAEELIKTYESLTEAQNLLIKTGLGVDTLNSILINATGDLGNLTSSLEVYFTEFFTLQEQFTSNFTELSKEFEKLGLIMPQSKEAFKELMDTIEESGDNQLLGNLIGKIPDWVKVYDAYEELISETDGFIDGFKDIVGKAGLTETGKSIVDLVKKYREAAKEAIKLGISLEDIEIGMQAFRIELNALADSLLDPFKDIVNKAGLSDIESSLYDLGQNYGDAIQAVYELGLSNAQTELQLDLLKAAYLIEYQNAIEETSDSIVDAIKSADDAIKDMILDIKKQMKGFDNIAYLDGEEERVLLLLSQSTELENQINLQTELAEIIKERYDLEFEAMIELNDAITSMSDYITDFKQGDLSILVPVEKLNESEALFSEIATKALTGDVEAINALPDAIETYAQNARDYFASGDDYTKIYNEIIGITDYIDANFGQENFEDASLRLQQETINELEAIREAIMMLSFDAINGIDVETDIDVVSDNIDSYLDSLSDTKNAQNQYDENISNVVSDDILENYLKSAIESFQDSGSSDIETLYNEVYDAALFFNISATRLAEALAEVSGQPGNEDTLERNILGWIEENDKDDLKLFAKGGISDEPAIFGDAGAEAAVPLDANRSIPVTLHQPNSGDGANYDELVNEIRMLREEQARQADMIAESNYEATADMAEKLVEQAEEARSEDRFRANSKIDID